MAIINQSPSLPAGERQQYVSSPAGWLGIFGDGLFRVFSTSGTFTVPSGVTSIRVRVLGAGADGTTGGRGGCGGGYAHGVFSVTPAAAYTVTVGAGGAPGGSSSFGALISATGGSDTVPGAGTGGDFQASGGSSGATANTGGGGAGSQLGDGGSSGAFGGSGGGGVGGGSSIAPSGSGGGSPFEQTKSTDGGRDIIGTYGAPDGEVNPINAALRFPFDGFTGGGGSGTSTSTDAGNGGIGAGGGGNSGGVGNSGIPGNGGDGGGGGGSNNTSPAAGGDGSYGGGGGGSPSGVSIGDGGNGLVIVEW